MVLQQRTTLEDSFPLKSYASFNSTKTFIPINVSYCYNTTQQKTFISKAQITTLLHTLSGTLTFVFLSR